jgi:hypothetical protein
MNNLFENFLAETEIPKFGTWTLRQSRRWRRRRR